MQNHNKKLRCAIIGTGFWANYQIAAWLEIPDVQIVALYNRTKNKAEAINEKFGLNATIYDDYEALLKNEKATIITEQLKQKGIVNKYTGVSSFFLLSSKHSSG